MRGMRKGWFGLVFVGAAAMAFGTVTLSPHGGLGRR